MKTECFNIIINHLATNLLSKLLSRAFNFCFSSSDFFFASSILARIAFFFASSSYGNTFSLVGLCGLVGVVCSILGLLVYGSSEESTGILIDTFSGAYSYLYLSFSYLFFSLPSCLPSYSVGTGFVAIEILLPETIAAAS